MHNVKSSITFAIVYKSFKYRMSMLTVDQRNLLPLSILLLASCVSAQDAMTIALAMIEAHVGLVLLIASVVIILMMILMLFFLQSISEHLNWIRRIR